MKKIFILLIIGVLSGMAFADDRTLTGGEYWIDQTTDDRVQVSIGGDGLMQFTVEAGFLSEGLHALHYRAKDSEGFYSPVQSWLFYRATAPAEGSQTLDYWVDEQAHQTLDVTDSLLTFVLDASGLSEGLHLLHYRTTGSNGQNSPVQTWAFFRQRMASEKAKRVTNYEYWIDDRHDLTVQGAVEGEEVQFVLDASAQAEGLHALRYRLTDDQGRHSPVLSWMFFRYAADELGASTLEYWIDEAEMHDSLSVVSSETAFVLDASAVEEGLHTLHYRLNSQTGTVGPERTWLFYRVAPAYNAGNRTLEYWIDDAETHQAFSASDADVAFVLDASDMEEGLHTLHYQVVEEGGRKSSARSWLFYRVAPKPVGSRISWYRIWWNGHQDKAVEVQLPDGGSELLYEETLAVPEYARNDGYSHDNTARFHIVFGDDQGNTSPVETAVMSYPDIYPPVTTLTANKTGDGIALSWTSNEDGVRDWNVYYSENGEPYVLWKSNVKEQSATFRGQQGATYRFIVTARDQHGNYEAIDASRAVKVTY